MNFIESTQSQDLYYKFDKLPAAGYYSIYKKLLNCKDFKYK